MNVLLWVLQALLAVGFLAHGWLFLFPPAEMVDLMNECAAKSVLRLQRPFCLSWRRLLPLCAGR
jgi:uncharacterized membrane protein YphA (DoxX/SURF4 family)